VDEAEVAHGRSLGSFANLAQDANSMFSLKTHAIITGGLFGAIIVMATVGNELHDSGGYIAESSVSQFAARIVFFALFLTFGFSCIPLMVKLVLAGQTAIGNGEVGFVRFVAAHQTRIVIGFWLFCLLGLAIAIPAAVHDGFFDADPAASAAVNRPR
jgi:uncharacterized membrane protein